MSAVAPPPIPRRRTLGTRVLRWTLTLFVLALLIGIAMYLAQGEPGYVLLSFGALSIETSVWVAALVLVLLFLALQLVLATWRAFFGYQGWWRRRGRERARKRTIDGLLAMHDGDFENARKLLLAALPAAEAPALNLLEAARAARALGAHSDAERYLEQAETHLGAERPLAALARAEHGTNGASAPSIAELQALRGNAPKHPGVLRALVRALEAGREWSSLRALVSELRKTQLLMPNELTALEQRIFRGVAGSATTVDSLMNAWAELPKSAREESGYVRDYALALHRLGADHEAEPLLGKALERAWDAQLVAIYGALRSDPARQIRQLEAWLSRHADDPAALQAHARLNAASENWLVARNSLEAAHRLYSSKEPSARGPAAQRCAIELAEARLRLGETDAALELLAAQRV